MGSGRNNKNAKSVKNAFISTLFQNEILSENTNSCVHFLSADCVYFSCLFTVIFDIIFGQDSRFCNSVIREPGKVRN